ncbi:hypothetical protein D3C87_76080 [compost metagenome]
MFDQFEELVGSLNVMAELSGVKDFIDLKWMYEEKEIDFKYLSVTIGRSFRFDHLFYRDHLEVRVYLMLHNANHKRLSSYLNTSTFKTKNLSRSDGMHQGEYIFENFSEFEDFFSKVVEISNFIK